MKHEPDGEDIFMAEMRISARPHYCQPDNKPRGFKYHEVTFRTLGDHLISATRPPFLWWVDFMNAGRANSNIWPIRRSSVRINGNRSGKPPLRTLDPCVKVLGRCT